MLRALGMLHENAVLDKTEFDSTTNNLRRARYRLYSNREASVEARRVSPSDYDTNKIGEYVISADYSGTNLLRYLVAKEFPIP